MFEKRQILLKQNFELFLELSDLKLTKAEGYLVMYLH
jgi:hypothetical protein